jgi:predicted glycosyl hydrolase (DUF1957 family)
METDFKIYDECVAELSKESRNELNAMVDSIQDNLHAKRLRPTGLGGHGAKEILICLIRAGFLPLANPEEAIELQRRMGEWGRP